MSESGGGMSWRFVTCAALFITCLLTANIIAAKLVVIGGVVLPAGIVIFPISYILADVLTEVWGYGAARRVIWLGFACNALMVAATWVGGALVPAPFWKEQAAYEAILGQTPRLLGASFVAYLAGEFANAFVMAKVKIWTKGRWLWSRSIGSTASVPSSRSSPSPSRRRSRTPRPGRPRTTRRAGAASGREWP